MKRSSNILLSIFVLLFLPLSGYSATTEFRVLLDTDNSASTGCSVSTPAGPFTGVDQVLITTVDTSLTGGSVTSVARQVCSGGVFGSPIPVAAPAPWPVGFDGASGNSIVESVLPLDILGTPAPAQVRVAFLAATGLSVDSITQTPGAAPLLWPSTLELHRRHATGPGAIPQLITLDGQTQDWGGIAPFVPGGSGGPSTPKFINVYLFADTTNLWFRFDAKLPGIGGGNAPVAVDDTYSVRQGKSLSVNAPGVLANDSDPNNAPLTPSVVSNPQHGTLALDPSGAFVYINDGSNSPVDTFTYKDSNGTATSNTANVTLNVVLDHRPVGVPDAYNVGHGATLVVPAPGVLANDTDADGDHLTAVLLSGPQHGTLTLNANGSFTYIHNGSNTLQDTFTYRASDGVLFSPATLVTITIGPVAPLITSANSTTFTAGTPGTFTVTTTGFPPPAITETGALPSGITLIDNGNGTATLGGTAAGGSGGVYPIVIHATNTGGTANQNFTITVCNVIVVTNPATTTGTAGTAFSQTFTQSGAVGGATFTTSSALPTGLSLSTGGLLSGTPTQTGTFPIVVTVTDANGCTGTSSSYNLVIGCQTINVTNPATNTGTAGTPFSQTFTQTGAIGTATFTTASPLPAGLTLSTAGVLSGTPTVVGTFPIVVTVTDSNNCTGSGATYNLVIGCPTITVGNPATTTGTAGVAFSQNFTQAGAVGTATFTTASALPAGMTLSAAGLLSGTPTVTGTFPINVTVTDSNSCTGTNATYTLVINCQTITVTNPATTTGTVSTPFSQSFTQSGAIGGATFTTASTLPTGMTLSTAGLLSGTPSQPGTFPIVVTVTDGNGCTGNSATYTLIISCQVITVGNPNTSSWPAGTPLPAANFTFTQTGAIGGATFTTASPLPTGVTLTTAGVLTGTPMQGGSFPITVTVTDGNNCTGTSSGYSLTINCPTITVTSPANSTGTSGVAFSEQFTQAGGVGTITWSETGALPSGITLNPSTGVLSGTTNAAGPFPITVTATDQNGCTGTSSTYPLTINCQTITVTNPGVNTGTVNAAFSQTFTVSGILGTVTWSETGALPSGITLNPSTGVLSGTPTQPGTFPITVKATDTNLCFGTSSYTLTINCQTITVTNPANSTGTAGVAFSEQFTQTGGVGTITWSVSGALPSGITLNTTTGILSGTTNAVGTFPITVTATDSNNCQGTGATYNLTINCQTITVTNPGVNTGTVNAAFSQTFTVSGILGTVTWSETGALPAGITLDSSTGVLSGTPTVNGVFPITVKATDTNLCFGTSSYTLTINCQTITVTNPVNNNATVGTSYSGQFTQTGAIGGATFTTVSTLPTGVTLSASGLLSGTPTESGSFPIDVTVTDGNSCTGTNATFTLIVTCQTINVGNPNMNSWPAGTPLPAANFTFTQTGAIGTATFTTASTLPTGVTLTTAGVLTGTPMQSGTFGITVIVTDGNNCTGTSSGYSLTINCPTITVTNPGVNTGTAGVAFSQTFTQAGGVGTITWSETGALPSGITLNPSTGVLSGTTNVAGTFPITVTATDQNGCQGTGSTYTLTINCQTITVTNPGVNTGTVNAAFSQTFTVSGILGTVTWSETGALPAGITLNPSTGVLSGTPTQPGTFPITVKATDTNLCFGTSSYTLTINCQTITVTNPATNTGTAGVAFSQTFTQTGGVGTITWSVSGALPSGITLNTSTGVLSGTTNAAGTFPITVTATDSNNCQGTGATYNLTINCQTITVTNPGVNTGTVNAAFSQTFTVSGILGTVTWSETGALPVGITLNPSTGVLSGTPTQPGTFPITVKATDTNLCFGTSSYTLTINCQTITVTNPVNNNATVGTSYSGQFTQTGAIGGATFTTASALPTGVTLSASGLLSGTPTESGSFPITVTVTDGNSCTGTNATFTLIVACQTITVTNPATTTGTAGTFFTATFTQSGGIGTITWSETGALPAGITLDPSTGVLSGTTSQVGSFPITVTATDQNTCSGTGATYTLVFGCQTISITNPAQTSVQAGVALNVTFTATGILGTATWSETGALPTGITLNSASGVLSGTTNQVGSFPITVKVTDTNLCFTTSSYTLTVTCPTITVTRTGGGSFPAGTFNTAYVGQSVVATGGSGSYTYAVTSGALPTGLSLSGAGAISGTPTATGTFTFVVTATDTASSCTGASATLSIAIAPAVIDDSFTNLVNNTQAVITGGTTASPATPFVPLSGAIIGNDLPSGGVAAVAGTFATTQSGSVTIAADGTFIYTPPVTVTALTTDSFTYTISSNTGATGTPTNASGTVNLALAGRVWYVKNNVANGNGQSQSPFNSTSNFTNGARVSPDKPGEIIFIHNGDGTTLNYTSGITLLANENLIGEGVALVVNTKTLFPAGTKPSITNTTAASDAVTLNDGNTIKGLNITGATRDGISSVIAHAGFTADTLTVQNNTNVGIDLISMTGTVTITNSTITSVGNQALTINNGTAAVTVDNTNTINGGTGTAVSVLNRPVAAGAIAIGATLSGGRIQLLTNLSGTISFTGSQTLSTTTNNAVTATTNAGATINFSGTLNVTTSTGIPFQATGGGTLNVSVTANLTSGAATNGLLLNGMTVGGTGVAFNSINTTGATTGISLVNVTGTVSVNGGTISGGTTSVSLQGSSTNLSLANVTLTGATTGITNTTNFGTLTIGASVNVSAATALNLTTGAVSGTFANLTSTGGTNGVNLNAVTGTWGATAGALSGATGATFNVTGGSGGTITWGGTISQANAATVATIAGSNSNTINFNGNVTASGTSTGISIASSTGTYNFSGTTNGITGSGGGVSIASEASGTVTFNSGTNINTTTIAVASFSVTSSSANVTYSGTITNNNNGGKLLNIDTYSVGTLTMNGTSLSGTVAAPNGVISTLNAITGTVVINNLSLTSSANAFANTLVAITGTNTGGSMTFNHLTLSDNGTGHTGKGLTAVGGGTLTITATGGASSIDASSVALDLNGQILGASAIATLNSSGGVNGIKLTSVTGGLLTITGGTIAGNTGSAFLVANGTPSVSYGGTITQNTAAQKAVDISGITGGTITLSGAIGSNGGNGVSIAGTGGTVNISGDMTLNNTTAVYSATGAGLTVTATSANNTIGATNAATTTAVTITNAAIGATGVTFKSISQNGGTKAISINNVGTAGAFVVTGTGTTAGSGGTIQNTTTRGAEFITFNKAAGNSVDLSNMNFTNNVTSATSPTAGNGTCGSFQGGGDNSTCNAVLHFNSVTNVKMTNVIVSGTTNSSLGQGINGLNVNGLDLTQVSVTKAGNEVDEEGIKMIGLRGTVNFDRVTSSQNASRGIWVEVTGSNSMIMTVKGGTYGNNTAPNGQQGILVDYYNTSGGSVTVQKDVSNAGTVFQNIVSNALDVHNDGNGTITLNVSDAVFTACNAALNMPHGSAAANTGTYNYNINSNNMTAVAAKGPVITLFNQCAGTQTGSITNNNIGNGGVAGSGCSVAGCDGIRITQSVGSGRIVSTITGNNIQRINEGGIYALATAGAGTLKLTIDSNTIGNSDNLGGSATHNIHIESGALSTDSNVVCTTITNNILSGANWLAGIRLTERSTGGTAVIHVPGMGAATPNNYLGCGATPIPCTSASTGNQYAAGMAATVSTANSVDGNGCPF